MSDLSGTSFKSADVAELYIHRPPYAAQIYDHLAHRAPSVQRLLDLGSGEGKIARPMARVFEQVVAVDPSAKMIDLGKSLENGQAPNLTWVEATAEDAPLSGLFDVVSFASSIHWMAPEPLFAKLSQHLKPDALVAIVSGDEAFDPPWQADWLEFLKKWVPIASGRPFGSDEWTNQRDRHLAHLEVAETVDFVSEPFQQTVEGYRLCQHSRNTFTYANLGDRLPDFQRDITEVLKPHTDENGLLSYRVQTRLTLARPKPIA